jgi:DNA-binding CsgD family transcriptional regulator
VGVGEQADREAPAVPAIEDDSGLSATARNGPTEYVPPALGANGKSLDREATPLLERHEELGAITRALHGARAAEGSIVMIEAAPGLGKTRLVEAAVEASGGLLMQALTAAGRELERDFAFGLALQLFEARLARASEARRERLLSGAADLARPLLEGAHTSEDGRFAYLHGLYWLAANLAEERPLLLAIDDAQWSDPPSLRFLLYLAQRIGELPMTVVLAMGRGDAPQRDRLLDELAAHPRTAVLRPRPLSGAGVARQLGALGLPNAEPSFAQACHEATAGNPFLLEELVADVVARGVPPTAENTDAMLELAPGSITTSVLVRLRRLGEETLELARAVAVLGNGAELRHAIELSSLDSARGVRAADALISAGVLDRGAGLSFSHPLVRAAVYRERSEPERADAHLRAARLLLAEHAPVERVAAQLLHARRDGDPRAVEVLSEAARHAIAAGAPGSAVRLLRRALEEPPTEEQRAKLLLALGRAEGTAGEAQAVERLTGAVRLMRDPAERASAALVAGRVMMTHGRWREAAETLELGLREPDAVPQVLRTRLKSAHAAIAGLMTPTEPKALDVDLEDPVLEESLAGRALLAEAASSLAMRGTPADEVRGLAMRALGGGALLDEETSDGIAYYLAVWALMVAEDIQAAELALTAAIEDARRRGSVLGFATASFFRAMAVLRRGRVEDAAGDAGNALSARSYGWALSLAGAVGVLVECHLLRGDSDAAAGEVAAWKQDVRGIDPGAYHLLAARGHLDLARMRPEPALDHLLDAGRLLGQQGWINPSVCPWRSLAAAAAMQLGDRERATALAEEELALARSFGAPGAIGQALWGMATLAEGAAAIETCQEAVRVLEDSQCALRRARASVELGAALRRASKRGDAREPLRLGLDLAHRCGARALAARAQEELVAAGGRPRRRAATGIDALTPRERQVAGLAAQGMSNREIAEALFVTLKTVEWHLSRAFEKVEVRSRRELGAALAGRKSD